MAGSAAARPRGEGGRRAAPRPRGKVKSAARGWVARWWKVALLVALSTIGLPLAHAMFGEVVALLGGAMLFGFLVGRWTAR